MSHGTGILSLATLGLALLAQVSGLAPGGEEPAPPDKGKEEAKKADPEAKDDCESPAATPKLSVDESYVRDKLAGLLHPTNIEFLDDGRVRLEFNFLEKTPDHGTIFKPAVSEEANSPFRWTLRGEEKFVYFKDGTTQRRQGGLRVADRGAALLKCWFLDDVEVAISYINSTTYDPRQNLAVLFQAESGKGLGCNFGTQCALYSAAGARGTSRGQPRALPMADVATLKLVVRNGTFESHLAGRRLETMSYKQRDYASGRVGFLWSGNVAGIITMLEVTGKLDVKKMARDLRKAPAK
jgi:hypothetical protein